MAQTPNPAPRAGEPDPSMDDILASIRRILSDEEKAAKMSKPEEGVLMLDPSMMIDDSTEPEHPMPQHEPERANGDMTDAGAGSDLPASAGDMGIAAPAPAAPAAEEFPGAAEAPRAVPPHGTDPLLAPTAAAAAASSVGTLMRTLISERNAVVHRGGPSLEDLVREEIRPLLKAWLDAHLPAVVERLVRAEIERVVGRVDT